jgi:hypothetical protein
MAVVARIVTGMTAENGPENTAGPPPVPPPPTHHPAPAPVLPLFPDPVPELVPELDPESVYREAKRRLGVLYERVLESDRTINRAHAVRAATIEAARQASEALEAAGSVLRTSRKSGSVHIGQTGTQDRSGKPEQQERPVESGQQGDPRPATG